MKIFDRLYGEIIFENYESELFHFPELIRLKRISQSTVPSLFLPTSICASRFEHSVGVAYLAKKLCQIKKEFKPLSKELYFASLLHDVGTPPFTHLTERYMSEKLGKNHEERARKIIFSSKIKDFLIKNKTSPQKISDLIEGKGGFLSEIINSSLDIDNLDNLLRFGFSTGCYTQNPYNPLTIIKAIYLKRNKLVLVERDVHLRNELSAWERWRKFIYGFIHSDTNLIPYMMLERAISLAYFKNQIKDSFFEFTDDEAINYLLYKTNPKTRAIIEDLIKWNFYKTIFRKKIFQIKDKHLTLIKKEPSFRFKMANELSSILKIPQEKISLYFGLNEAFRIIHYPIISGNKLINYKSKLKNFLLISVCIHPDFYLTKNKNKIENYLKHFL